MLSSARSFSSAATTSVEPEPRAGERQDAARPAEEREGEGEVPEPDARRRADVGDGGEGRDRQRPVAPPFPKEVEEDGEGDEEEKPEDVRVAEGEPRREERCEGRRQRHFEPPAACEAGTGGGGARTASRRSWIRLFSTAMAT